MSSSSNALKSASPEKMNQQLLAGSPSRPIDLRDLHRKTPKGVSDVQSRVAFLNNLSSSPTHGPASSGSQGAALQRAILGREEAESALASVSAQLSESQSRERRISERLESLLEDLQTAKERQAHERVVFEKEIKKVRKEAFRAGSALVKLQEELKHSRAEAKGLRDEVSSEREAKEHAKQEAFERTYALTGLTDELETLKGRLRSVEANSRANTLEAQARRMQRMEVGRTTLAEGDLAFLTTPRKHKRSADDATSTPVTGPTNISNSYETPPKRQRVSDFTAPEGVEDIVTPENGRDVVSQLQDELAFEKKQVAELEDMIHFMNMECQFKICSCRLAESKGETFIHDKEYAAKMDKIKAEKSAKNLENGEGGLAPVTERAAKPPPSAIASGQMSHTSIDEDAAIKAEARVGTMEVPLIAFSPASGTFRTISSPAKDPEDQYGEPLVISRPVESRIDSSPSKSITPSPLVDSSQGDAKHHNALFHSTSRATTPVQAVDSGTSTEDTNAHSQRLGGHKIHATEAADERPTTKTVPLRTEASPPSQFGATPGTPVDREEALAQIRARRGRTHSSKRSVSTSEATARGARTGVTPNRKAKRTPGFQQQGSARSEGDLSERRDLSAPVKMFRR